MSQEEPLPAYSTSSGLDLRETSQSYFLNECFQHKERSRLYVCCRKPLSWNQQSWPISVYLWLHSATLGNHKYARPQTGPSPFLAYSLAYFEIQWNFSTKTKEAVRDWCGASIWRQGLKETNLRKTTVGFGKWVLCLIDKECKEITTSSSWA